MIRILFICHGNICRSVAAQYIMQQLIEQAGLAEEFEIDSAATSAEEIGNPIYSPMKKVLERHHVPCEGHRARQMQRSDYAAFDYLIGMDRENLHNLNRMYGDLEKAGGKRKISLLKPHAEEIADPWYTRDFETAYREIRAGCEELLRELRMR